MSAMRDREDPTESVSLTMEQLWRLAAGESVTVTDDRTGRVEVEPPDPFDGTLPTERVPPR